MEFKKYLKKLEKLRPKDETESEVWMKSLAIALNLEMGHEEIREVNVEVTSNGSKFRFHALCFELEDERDEVANLVEDITQMLKSRSELSDSEMLDALTYCTAKKAVESGQKSVTFETEIQSKGKVRQTLEIIPTTSDEFERKEKKNLH